MIKRKEADDIINKFLVVFDVLKLTTYLGFPAKNLVKFYVAKGLVEKNYE